MELTARDVQEKQFHDAWRGYYQEEVDDFLDRISEVLVRVENENTSLRERVRELDQMLETSRSTEEMLKKTLLTAQQAAEEAIVAAREKAEALVTEAEERAARANEELRVRVETAEEEVRRKTIEAEQEAEARRAAIETSVQRLKTFEDEIVARLRSFLEQQLGSLNSYEAKEAAMAIPAAARPSEQEAEPVTADTGDPQPEPALDATQPHQAVVELGHESLPLPTGEHEEDDVYGDDAPRRNLRALFRRDATREDVPQNRA